MIIYMIFVAFSMLAMFALGGGMMYVFLHKPLTVDERRRAQYRLN